MGSDRERGPERRLPAGPGTRVRSSHRRGARHRATRSQSARSRHRRVRCPRLGVRGLPQRRGRPRPRPLCTLRRHLEDPARAVGRRPRAFGRPRRCLGVRNGWAAPRCTRCWRSPRRSSSAQGGRLGGRGLRRGRCRHRAGGRRRHGRARADRNRTGARHRAVGVRGVDGRCTRRARTRRDLAGGRPCGRARGCLSASGRWLDGQRDPRSCCHGAALRPRRRTIRHLLQSDEHRGQPPGEQLGPAHDPRTRVHRRSHLRPPGRRGSHARSDVRRVGSRRLRRRVRSDSSHVARATGPDRCGPGGDRAPLQGGALGSSGPGAQVRAVRAVPRASGVRRPHVPSYRPPAARPGPARRGGRTRTVPRAARPGQRTPVVAIEPPLPAGCRGIRNQLRMQNRASHGSADEESVFFRSLYGEAANDSAAALHAEAPTARFLTDALLVGRGPVRRGARRRSPAGPREPRSGTTVSAPPGSSSSTSTSPCGTGSLRDR